MQTRGCKEATGAFDTPDTHNEPAGPQASLTNAEKTQSSILIDKDTGKIILARGQVAAGDLANSQRKRKGQSEDEGIRKRTRLTNKLPSQSEAIDLSDNRPEPTGVPPAWSEKRAAIADCFPYFNAHQGSITKKDKFLVGLLIDSQVAIRDYFDDQIIITSPGGGLVADNATGKRVRDKDHPDNWQVLGAANPLFPVKPPHLYNVLDHFHVTYMWSEMVQTPQGGLVKAYKLRLEKVDLNSRSWWAPKNTDVHATSDVEDKHYACALASCLSCRKTSKTIYKQGWTCLEKDCKSFFSFSTKQDTPEIHPNQLAYNEDFLRERTRFTGKNLYPLVPDLPDITENTFGSEKIFKRGIVCARCQCCSRRMQWDRWLCENPACDYEYVVRPRIVPMSVISMEKTFESKGNKRNYESSIILTFKGATNTHEFITHFLPDEKEQGGYVGSVTIIRPMEFALRRQGGLDELFYKLQDVDLALERRGARCAGSRLEELTSHFSANYGAPYKFGVVVETTNSLSEAQPSIVETLLRLTWAGEISVMTTSQLIKDNDLPVRDGAIPNEFEKFNELLALGYFEGAKISAHDDGEKELAPTVATLSLGSASVMKFYPKKNIDVGTGVKSKGAKGDQVLSIVLMHGDMVVMHGAGIQKCYLHSVESYGIRRFAMTCRHIRPHTIADPQQRERAILDGEVSREWAAIHYNGGNDMFISNLTGHEVNEQVHQGLPINQQAELNHSETHNSSSDPTP
ncbi:hypothetical protein F5B19DRAFT_499810 [Rostrohypoxylon terebratum]|nr:hypothetical protein F5B19DRAFT_499810 [Rostrohypoxylon terebratum]